MQVAVQLFSISYGKVLITGMVFPSYYTHMYRECYSQETVSVCGGLNTCSRFRFICELLFGAQSLKSIPQQCSLAASRSQL